MRWGRRGWGRWRFGFVEGGLGDSIEENDGHVEFYCWIHAYMLLGIGYGL